jgi:DNA (cytosine-5)-methyltransferase 1
VKKTLAGAKRATRSVEAVVPASSINQRGVAAPTHRVKRPVAAGEIHFEIRVAQVAGGWIARPYWVLRDGQIPLDASPLRPQTCKSYSTRSEAVEAAADEGLRKVRAQRHRDSSSPAWAAKVERLAAWIADAVHEHRESDETLPLRGATGIDLFAGGHGGFSMALASLGVSIELACEIDQQALAAYKTNNRPKRTHDDICTLSLAGVKATFVVMGLLCQAFSPAGKGLGFLDPKLKAAYLHSIRVLREVDAKVVIVECARRFLTLDGGKHADELVDAMLESGYRVQHRALNAKGFGVPQDRERSILICTRDGIPVDDILGVVFPEESEPTSCVEDIMDADLPATIPDSEIISLRPEPTAPVASLFKVGSIDGRTEQGYRVYSAKGIGATLTASGGGKARFTESYKVGGGARPLTPREAARMQGMPEWAKQHPVHRHAMRHAGNAIAVPLARELGRALACALAREACNG